MSIDSIKNAFSKTHDRYCKILESYYPAHNRVGFTERNLTNNFVTSLEMVLGHNSISWFEAPINIESKKHIDAVVFGLDDGVSYMIESKRLSSPSQKIGSIVSDVERMKNKGHQELLEKNLKVKIGGRYGIVLADIWKENKKKIEIYNNWPVSIYSQAIWFDKKEFSHLNVTGSWKNNYSILIAVYEA